MFRKWHIQNSNWNPSKLALYTEAVLKELDFCFLLKTKIFYSEYLNIYIWIKLTFEFQLTEVQYWSSNIWSSINWSSFNWRFYFLFDGVQYGGHPYWTPRYHLSAAVLCSQNQDPLLKHKNETNPYLSYKKLFGREDFRERSRERF